MEFEQVVKELEHLFGSSRRPPPAQRAVAREREVLDLVTRLRGLDAAPIGAGSGAEPDGEGALAPRESDAAPIGTTAARATERAWADASAAGRARPIDGERAPGEWPRPGAAADLERDGRDAMDDA